MWCFCGIAMNKRPPKTLGATRDSKSGKDSSVTTFRGSDHPIPALPKMRVRRDNICLTGTYLVPLEPRTLLTNS
jgi:hypothetical protein